MGDIGEERRLGKDVGQRVLERDAMQRASGNLAWATWAWRQQISGDRYV